MAKVALFVGSVRKDRYGIKVARWINSKLLQRSHKVYFIVPLELQPPMLDRMYKEMTNPPEKLRDQGDAVLRITSLLFLATIFVSISDLNYNHSKSNY